MTNGAFNFPGSRWGKFDFHTHTPASKDFGRGDLSIKNNCTAEIWLQAAMKANLDCVAVTDHNSGTWYDDLKNKYDANSFIFYDEDFLISKKRLIEFLDLIEQENLKFYWRIWTRVNYFRENYLNRDLIVRLGKNGLRSVAMGAESGSQRILDLIQKGIKVENILHSAKMLNETKITPRYSFIVGLDGEEKADTKRTYKLCKDLMVINKRVDIAGPFIFRYYPGSPLFDRIIKNYNIEIPMKIEDWENALSDEGYLKLQKMPWLWPGCIETASILNKEIYIYDKLRNFNNFISTIIKWLIRWRLDNFNTKFLFELYAYNIMKKLYRKFWVYE